MLFLPILILCSFLALMVQLFLPSLPWFHGAEVLLVPIVMFYGTLALPWGMAMVLTFCSGLMWDLLTIQVVDSKVEISIGWSILVYSILGSMMHGFRPLFLKGRHELHYVLTGIFTFMLLAIEYLTLAFRRQDIQFTKTLWWQIGGSGIVAAVLAPLIFWLLGRLAVLVRYEPEPFA